ncbi:rab guanine nucleotide exchange factor S2 [Friedmanniomyces endolithicus]|nr:rab guanine nucleotide exchange factor S2 [Friedmanniomyces endolithicus]
MAAIVAPPHHVSAMRDGHAMMDTRTPSPVQRTGSTDGSPTEVQADTGAYKPDLGAEVAMLSTKLVNAINYQTNLDDSLQQTRHELEHAQKELAQVQQQKKEADDLLASGTLVRKIYADEVIDSLRGQLEAEKVARDAAEKAKKQTEGELENLTAALFEEANIMVATARKDTEAAERRSGQLRARLNDTELLLASQTEQLQDLKGVMERLERQSEYDGGRMDPSAPGTPIDSRTAAWDAALQINPTAGVASELVPDHPLHFSQLLAPIMRTDIAAYTDFHELLSLARRASPHSRQSSSSANNLASSSQTNLAASSAATSSPNLPGSFFSSAGNSPSSSAFNTAQPPLPPLKDSRFYKRVLSEDVEPTLRLDLAPGLSFLSRRSTLSSLLGGSLVVEPFNASIRSYGLGSVFACALCGENRKNEPFVRKHRFRTSEDDGAQRYPLCDYCLGRVRAAGDFVGFLRMLRDGHWRCEAEADEKGAWEEATRLRERMFWARLGGGVVPAAQLIRREAAADSPGSARETKSARPSLESVPERSARENLEAAGSSVMEVVRERSNQEATHSQAERPDPVPRNQRENRSASNVALAIMGMPTGVSPTLAQESRPDVQPAPHHQITRPTNGTVLDSEKLEIPSPEDEEPTTPLFEDALADSQEQQAEADAQLQREAASSTAHDSTPSEAPTAPAALLSTVYQPIFTPEGEADGARVDSAPVKATAPPPAEKRPSAVLARVRAMEGKAQNQAPAVAEKKLPGAFE